MINKLKARLQEVNNNIVYFLNNLNSGFAPNPSDICTLGIMAGEECIITSILNNNSFPHPNDVSNYISRRIPGQLLNTMSQYSNQILSEVSKIIDSYNRALNSANNYNNYNYNFNNYNQGFNMNNNNNSLGDGMTAGIGVTPTNSYSTNNNDNMSSFFNSTAGIDSTINTTTTNGTGVGVLNTQTNINNKDTVYKNQYIDHDIYITDYQPGDVYSMTGYLLADGLSEQNGKVLGDIRYRRPLDRLKDIDLDNKELSYIDTLIELDNNITKTNSISKVINTNLVETKFLHKSRHHLVYAYPTVLVNILAKTLNMNVTAGEYDKETEEYFDKAINDIKDQEYNRIAVRVWEVIKSIRYSIDVKENTKNSIDITYKDNYYVIHSEEIFKDLSTMNFKEIKTLDDISHPVLFRALNNDNESLETLPKYSVGRFVVIGESGVVHIAYIRICTKDNEFYNICRL